MCGRSCNELVVSIRSFGPDHAGLYVCSGDRDWRADIVWINDSKRAKSRAGGCPLGDASARAPPRRKARLARASHSLSWKLSFSGRAR